VFALVDRIIVKKITFDLGLTFLFVSSIISIEREVKKMIWIVFIIWVVFTLVCAVMENKTNKGFYMFMILVSIPIMFYIPFMF